VDLVANTPEEMITYLDFVMDNCNLNFSVDAYMTKVKVPASDHVRKRGQLDKFVYNSISLWEKDLDGEIKSLADIGVKHIILAPWDVQDDFSTGRIKGLESLLEFLDRGGNPFESIIVDTSAMNLPTTMICNNAGTLIKERYGYPCGTGAANGVYMWREACQKMGETQSFDLHESGLPPSELGKIKSFIAMDATTEAIASLGMDFVMYGPIENAPALFPAVAAAQANVAGMVLDQYKKLPAHPDHPFNKLFPEMVEKFQQFQAGVEVERKWLPKGSAAKKGAKKEEQAAQ
jgi:tetrahydromethanopterin S-methyltransferase subunit H